MTSYEKFMVLLEKESLLYNRRGGIIAILIFVGIAFAMAYSNYQNPVFATYKFDQITSVYNSSEENVNVYSIGIPKTTGSSSIISSSDFVDLPAYKNQD